MLKAAYNHYDLIFKEPATTSRETMNHKETYFLRVWDTSAPDVVGVGECALFRGLSQDDKPDYEYRLHALCAAINNLGESALALNDSLFTALVEDSKISQYSSIIFGLETALLDLKNGGLHRPFPSPWSLGRGEIPINGLVWMGSIEQMEERVAQKIAHGFRCVKFKIGGQNFDDEVRLLESVRAAYPADILEIRLDANGAFSPDNALERLDRLSKIGVHSLEQPIKAGQRDDMARICALSPIPIALDEELIGINDKRQKTELLSLIKPQYIILKPSLCGGFAHSEQWIELAETFGIGWWVTSALESNVGLNALAQWVSTLSTEMPQGLGTGALYTNNIESPICQYGATLSYSPDKVWGKI